MQLFAFPVFTALLALKHVASSYAYPRSEALSVVATAQHHSELDKRVLEIVVPVSKESESDTWRGYRVMPGFFGSKLSEADVIASTKATYYSIAGKTTASTLLVSVIYVPQQGLAAGTMWAGSSAQFETFAENKAPVFWSGVGGIQQGLKPWTETKHMWHAEAVAAVTAEEEFSEGIVDGLWPEGTMIYTFGRIGNTVVDKPSCRGTNAPVLVPCAEWLDRINIEIIEP